MKMYILVKKDISVGHAIVAVAHASLACYLKFKDSEEVKQWLFGPFYKTVCVVSEEEFKQSKEAPDHVVISESALAGLEVAIAFKPREEYPKSFKFFPLYKSA